MTQLTACPFFMRRPGRLNLWLPLDDVSDANGGLRVLPRMHHWGALPEGPIVDDDGRAEAGAGSGIAMGVLKPKLREAVSYCLRAGQPAAHHPWTPHCSGENTTEQPRRVLLIRLLPLELARRYQDIHGAPIALASWRAGWRRRTPAAIRCAPEYWWVTPL